MKKSLVSIWTGLFMLSTLVALATDGTQGTTSTATSSLSVTKVQHVRLTGVADIDFGSVSSAPAAGSTYDSVCIFSTTGSYTVTATSTNASSTTFRLKNAASAYINYDVQWKNTDSGTSGTDLNSGVASSTFTGANFTSSTCGGVMNSRFFVDLDDTTLSAASAGTYTDTLTFTVAPI